MKDGASVDGVEENVRGPVTSIRDPEWSTGRSIEAAEKIWLARLEEMRCMLGFSPGVAVGSTSVVSIAKFGVSVSAPSDFDKVSYKRATRTGKNATCSPNTTCV